MSDLLREILHRALHVMPGDYALTLRPAIDDQTNRLYDVRTARGHFIAKEFLRPEEIPAAPEREFRALQVVAALDIAPQPVFFDLLRSRARTGFHLRAHRRPRWAASVVNRSRLVNDDIHAKAGCRNDA
jgi:hypothetical protein